MKNCFIAIVLFLTGVLAAADTAILRFAPDSTIAIVGIDLAGLMKHPDVVSALNEPENLAKRREFEKMTGVKLFDFKQMYILVNAKGEALFLAGVDTRFDAEQIFRRNKLQYKKFKVATCDVLQLTKPVKNGKIIEVTTLAPGVILAGEKGDIANYFALKRGNVSTSFRNVVSAVPGRAPFWIAFANIFKDPKGRINDPQSLYLTFDFAGKAKRDYALKLVLNCANDQGAQVMQGMVPMYVNMGVAMGVNDQALAGELTACIKTAAAGRQVIVSALIPEALGKRVGEYFKNNAAKLLPQGQAAPAEKGK